MAMRYLMGVTSGEGLTKGQASADDLGKIKAHLKNCSDALNVDGEREADWRDGALIARYCSACATRICLRDFASRKRKTGGEENLADLCPVARNRKLLATHPHKFAQYAALSAAFLLGGCGGNGVSSAPYVPPCPSFPCEAPTARKLQTPDDAGFMQRKKEFEESPEYRVDATFTPLGRPELVQDRHKDQIKAAAAYARGATGKDEIVAVSDTYIYPGSRELGETRGFPPFVTSTKVTVAGPQDVHLASLSILHGTEVATMIAGKRDGENRSENMHGIAFDAMLVFKQVDLTSDYPGDAHQ